MTEKKHIAIVTRTMRKCRELGYSEDQIAVAIVNRVREEIELEIEESDAGILDFPAAQPEAPVSTPKVEWKNPLPPPAANEAASGLITDLSSPEAVEVMRAPARSAPLRMKPPTEGEVSSTRLRKYWDTSSLRDHIEQNTPEVLQVSTKGRKEPVTLQRNLEIGLGIDIVKLIYSIGNENHPTPSSPNLQGEELPPIPVDTPVFINFSCYERDPQIETRIEQLREQASQVYRPKPDRLDSFTPRRTGGYLSFGETDPHDEVGALKNPTTGRVW